MSDDEKGYFLVGEEMTERKCRGGLVSRCGLGSRGQVEGEIRLKLIRGRGVKGDI